MTRLAAITLALALAATLATPAGAAIGPGNQRKAIQAGALKLLPRADRKKVVVQSIKVSTVSRSWAIASVNAKPAFEATFQSFVVVLLKVPRINNSTYWVVADFGGAFVGCGVAPLAVLRDLYRARRPCAGAS